MTINSFAATNPASCNRFVPVIYLWIALLSGSAFASTQDDQSELHRLRQERREASYQLQHSKSQLDSPAQFSLLVIPVDFSDTRLPENWNPETQLSSQLNGSGDQTLANYFQIASGQNLALITTIAPLVSLTGPRSSYSDVGVNGFSRTRAMATEVISFVANLGLEFRKLDNDGPDGLPGTDDDDGQVDGILILHAAPGQENDPDNGLIQPLQFFIDPPVESGGVQAAFYAVASLHSGLGIWAHETGHLLGMEDRYDPLLTPNSHGSDVRSLGGLGRFSLMASGAFGSGDGDNPALPDAYTCLQLGWVQALRLPSHSGSPFELRPWREGYSAVQIWSEGPLSDEFFILETRDPQATEPFDYGLPRGQMLVYHVDENVPDGSYLPQENGQYHLRVRLVEADNDAGLEEGNDDGHDEDSFPGPLGVHSLTPTTTPTSDGYYGPSYVSLEEITSSGNFLTMNISDSQADYVVDLDFSIPAGPVAELSILVQCLGQTVNSLSCSLELQGTGGGSFAGGAQSVNFTLANNDGLWTPTSPILFTRPDNPSDDASTEFDFLFTANSVELPEQVRHWVWLYDFNSFDFNNPDWVFWDQQYPEGTTSSQWHLWNEAPFLTEDQSAILACTGENYPYSDSWPNVNYGNSSHAVITSPILGETITAVQLTHAIEVEYLHADVVMDGATAFWQGHDGTLIPANPVDGWNARISPQSNNSLNGAGAFADSLMELSSSQLPLWQMDILELPDAIGGPWRLRLEFSSNSLWRRRGWFVARMVPMENHPQSAFPISWNSSSGECQSGLFFALPTPTEEFNSAVVEFFDESSREFVAFPNQEDLLEECSGGFVLPRALVLDSLQPSGLTRHLVRVVATGNQGKVASRAVVVYPDEGSKTVVYLEQPYPNPSTGGVKFLVDIPAGKQATLGIYDLRGRLVFTQDYSSGRHQAYWTGTGNDGRRLSAGNYYIRLEGSGFSSLRKVVLIR